MLDRPALIARPFAMLVVCGALLLGCASSGPVSASPPPTDTTTGSASATGTAGAASTSTPPSTPEPSAEPGAVGGGVPTACMSLGARDCERAAAMAIALVGAADPPVIYLQVGPFGCGNGQPDCAATLEARPEGDVVIELDGAPAISVHIKLEAGVPSAEKAETFGIVLEPTPGTALPVGPRPFALGHCGLYSGIDAGGSWWDPVGAIDADHSDAINAASGVMTLNDPDHAIFVSQGGFTVQLLRRDGPKHLPFCD